MTALLLTVLATVPALGAPGGTGGAESFPSPTLFVIVYALLWLALVGWLIWLATRQHGLDRSLAEVQSQLQTQLDEAERRISAQSDTD